MDRLKFDWLLWNLYLVDMQELVVDAGAIADRAYEAWDAFCANRMNWYLRAPEAKGYAVFKAILNHKPGAEHLPRPSDNVVDMKEWARGGGNARKGKD